MLCPLDPGQELGQSALAGCLAPGFLFAAEVSRAVSSPQEEDASGEVSCLQEVRRLAQEARFPLQEVLGSRSLSVTCAELEEI